VRVVVVVCILRSLPHLCVTWQQCNPRQPISLAVPWVHCGPRCVGTWLHAAVWTVRLSALSLDIAFGSTVRIPRTRGWLHQLCLPDEWVVSTQPQVRTALQDAGHATALAAFQKADSSSRSTLSAAQCTSVVQQLLSAAGAPLDAADARLLATFIATAAAGRDELPFVLLCKSFGLMPVHVQRGAALAASAKLPSAAAAVAAPASRVVEASAGADSAELHDQVRFR
jgi:hypothetical protein